MKMMTKAIAEKLYEKDLQVIENGECGKDVVVKYFYGSATWLITSGTPLDAVNGQPTTPENAKDWHLFGLCDLHGDGGELGYVLLSELESFRSKIGARIERDMYMSNDLTVE